MRQVNVFNCFPQDCQSMFKFYANLKVWPTHSLLDPTDSICICISNGMLYVMLLEPSTGQVIPLYSNVCDVSILFNNVMDAHCGWWANKFQDIYIHTYVKCLLNKLKQHNFVSVLCLNDQTYLGHSKRCVSKHSWLSVHKSKDRLLSCTFTYSLLMLNFFSNIEDHED